MDCAALAQRQFAQVGAVAQVVGFGEEAGLAVVAPLDDVLRDAGEVQSGGAGHGGRRGEFNLMLRSRRSTLTPVDLRRSCCRCAQAKRSRDGTFNAWA